MTFYQVEYIVSNILPRIFRADIRISLAHLWDLVWRLQIQSFVFSIKNSKQTVLRVVNSTKYLLKKIGYTHLGWMIKLQDSFCYLLQLK
jgi:hypothetical protein